MPLSALDPITALIVIDLQKGHLHHPFVEPLAGVIGCNRRLLEAFRGRNLPVVLVNVQGRAPGRTEKGARSAAAPRADWTDLLPELNQQPEDIIVTKRSWGAFATTDLQAQLMSRGVTQVVVTGLVTSGGVEATARQAYEQGFHVTLPLDAMTDISGDAQSYTVRSVFPRLGETGSTGDILNLLEQRSEHV